MEKKLKTVILRTDMNITEYLVATAQNAWFQLVLYCISQTGVLVLLKLSTVNDKFYWYCLIFCNVLTAFGMWLFSLVLHNMNPNIATAIGLGGVFLTGQLLLALLFNSRLSFQQIVGITLIFVGIMIVTLTKQQLISK